MLFGQRLPDETFEKQGVATAKMLSHVNRPAAWREVTTPNELLLAVVVRTVSAAVWNRIAADPKHLGAELGVLAVLHTWGGRLAGKPE
jgi:hypothetical protein